MTKRGEARLAKAVEQSHSDAFDRLVALSNQVQPLLQPLTRDELFDFLVMQLSDFCLDGDNAHLALGLVLVRVGANIDLNREPQS